jgi:ligand-binding sensor domain-containing protein
MQKYITVKIILLISISIRVNGINVQQPDFETISIEDGLPHYTINDIFQDYENYIWIATNNGLAKYNSLKYTIYESLPYKSDSIAYSQRILTLYGDSQNRMWVGTNNSLCLYNKKTDSFKAYFLVNKNSKIVEKVPVKTIFEKNDSTFFIGTDGGGLYIFNPLKGTYSQYKKIVNIENDERSIRIYKITSDWKGNIWIATLSHGLLKYDSRSDVLIAINKENFNIKEIRAIIQLEEDKLLLGTYGDGLWDFEMKTQQFRKNKIFEEKFKKYLKRIFLFHISPDRNKLLIGTDGGGLFMLNRNQNKVSHFYHYGYNPYSIANNAVQSILIDEDNNVWLGHYKGGISFSSHRQPFYNIRHNPALQNTLSSNIVSCILKDKNNNTFVGTDGGGLNIILPNGEITNQLTGDNQIINQLKAQSILALYEDKGSNIIIGTYLDGVFKLDTKTKKVTQLLNSTSTKPQINNDDIRCFYEDRENRLWIGTNGGGVNIYNPESNTVKILQRNQLDLKGSLSLDWIRCIEEDSYGFIWIGTAYGLNKYDPVHETFTKYFYHPKDTFSLSNNFIYSIFEDSKKNLWIGTSHGLNKYIRTSDSFKNYTISQGLTDNVTYNITEDGTGHLWISTSNGISRMNPAKETFYNYDSSDGLLSDAFINGAIFQSEDSIIYLGSVAGLTYFKPSEIKNEIMDSPLLITDFRIHNRTIPIGKKINDHVILPQHISYTHEIELTHKENFISFEFTVLNYSKTGKVQYAYRLDNFDKKWNTPERQQNWASYTDLKPGEYTFRVRTTNLKENKEKAINITIKPSFWQSIWFKLLLVAAMFTIIYYWNHIRILKIKKQKVFIEKKRIEEKLKYEKEQTLLKTQNLRYEMENKNAQLTSTTLLISHKSDIMKKVKSTLTNYSLQVNSKVPEDVFSKVIEIIDNEFKVEEDWQRFEEHFNHIHKNFFIKLKDAGYQLSPTYLKLCAYLKMNMTSKEIASLMNISVRGVEKARSRLREKLKLSRGENLSTFISNF